MEHSTVRNLAASVYGTVLTIAMIVAYSADSDLDPLLIAVAVLVTVAVFWVAHVHAELLAMRYALGHPLAGSEIRAQLRHGWPMVEAAFLPAIALALGGIGVFDDDTSVVLALGIGVAQLAAWGVAIGRRERLRLLGVIGVTALNVGLGLVVVALKLFIH